MSRVAPSRGRGGFALIGALWLLVMLSVVGLQFALEARTLTRRVADASDAAQARAAAEGGLAYAADALTQRLESGARVAPEGDAPVDPWQEPGRLLPDTLEIGDALCVVRMSDAGTRLHLNRATEAELRRLMGAVRIDEGDADRATQAILDWRDMDGFRRARGAEEPEYVEAGAPALPADGPFGSVEELRDVVGVTPGIYERIAPFLTVSGSGRISLRAAPPQVLATLPGMSGDLLALVLRTRSSGGSVMDLMALSNELPPREREVARQNLSLLLGRVSEGTEEVWVTAEAWVPGSAVRVTESAVVVRSGNAVFVVERSGR